MKAFLPFLLYTLILLSLQYTYTNAYEYEVRGIYKRGLDAVEPSDESKSVLAVGHTEELYCHANSVCAACPWGEMDMDVCADTGRRREVKCVVTEQGADAEELRSHMYWESCNTYPEDFSNSFFIFMAAMIVLLGMSVYMVYLRHKRLQKLHHLKMSKHVYG